MFINKQDLVKNKIWRAPLAACLLSALLVIGFDLLSCVMLIKWVKLTDFKFDTHPFPSCTRLSSKSLTARKSINRAGPGFGYGFIVAYSFALAFFLLLCGLVLDGFKQVVKETLEPAAGELIARYTAHGTPLHAPFRRGGARNLPAW